MLKKIIPFFVLLATVAHAAVPTRLENGVYAAPWLRPAQNGLPLGSSTLRWNASVTNLNTQLSEGLAYIAANGDLSSNSSVTVDANGSVLANYFVGPLVGNASTASALAADPTDCPAGEYAQSIDTAGNLVCASISTGNVTGPGSSTNNAAAIWSGTSGTVLADSQLLISGSVANISVFQGYLSGNASTASALFSDPTDCPAGEYAQSIDAFGNLTCSAVTSSTANALAADPTDCSAGQYAHSIDAQGNLTCGTPSGGGGGGTSLAEAPMIHLSHGNGYGSTNTMIRRFSRINKNSGGTHITLTQSSTNGDSFTINTAGMYAICYGDYRNGDMAVAVTVNDSAMTTTARTPITYAQGLRSMYNGVSLNDYASTCDVTDLAVNDVVRAHSDGNNGGTDQHSYFYIVYLGAQSGNELYIDGGTGYGSTNTLIRTWTNTRLNTGSAFTYTQDATNGDYITVNSDGLYWVCRAELRTSSGQLYSGITVNDSALGTDVYSMTYAQGRRFTNLLAGSYYTQTSQNCGPLSLTSGDVVRGHDTAGSLSNGTDARVSIKMIKMNSAKRATFFDTPSGFGSVATKLRYMTQVRDYGASIGYGISGLYGTTLATFSGGVYVGCLQDYGATVPTTGVMINPKAESSNVSTSRDYNDGFRGIRANGAGSSSSHHCAFDYMGPGGQIAFGSDGSGGTDAWISFAGALIN